MEKLLYVLVIILLIILSAVDIKKHEIPLWININILVIGIIHLILDYQNYLSYVIGFFAVSLPLYLILIFTKGQGIGGGDVKLMAAAGLLLGWKQIVLAFVLACIIGAIIHLSLMLAFKFGRELAFGPYLSAGIIIALFYGEKLIDWYITSIL